MKILELGSLKGIEFKTKQELSEEQIALLNEIEVNDDTVNAFKGLLTKIEAESDATLFTSVKDEAHRAAKKGIYDSIDANIKEYLDTLSSDEKSQLEKLDSKDKLKSVLKIYKSKLANADTDAEKAALKQEYDNFKASVDTDYVKKEVVGETQNELNSLRLQLEGIKSSRKSEILTSSAIQSGIVDEKFISSPILPSMVLSAVENYLKKPFKSGGSEVYGQVVMNDNMELSIQQKVEDKFIPISVDSKIVNIQDVVASALREFNLAKEEDKQVIIEPRGKDGEKKKLDYSDLLKK